jgi:hypothetical protein
LKTWRICAVELFRALSFKPAHLEKTLFQKAALFLHTAQVKNRPVKKSRSETVLFRSGHAYLFYSIS